MEKDIVQYLITQHCSAQWRGFMGALAQELTQHLTPNNLRGLMRRAGQRFARQHPLPESDTIGALQSAINGLWQSMNWGWVSIDDEHAQLVIRHYLSPLPVGMLPENMPWSNGFLEGAYEQWLHQSGADESLCLRQSAIDDSTGTVEYRLEHRSFER